MKYERLVEMAKAIGRQQLLDKHYARLYPRTFSKRRRYEPTRHLAQEEDEQIDKTPNKVIINPEKELLSVPSSESKQKL